MTPLALFTGLTLAAIGIIWLLDRFTHIERRPCPGCSYCDERRGQ